ncbi:MAG: biotin--[acetyl-CoA-carboxylase] ligase [Acidobacteria bacterium]|nr:MAG: biotin--[acetyl-CoA-carboxylase] ligase [Acidobacteriota bacterium]
MNITVLTFDSLDSTNTEALKQARLGADEGLCIVAGEQTAGRGRHGRTWVSQKDAGLYFSIVLRPKINTKFLPVITLMTGVVVHDTLQDFGLKPDIKWVNDVLIKEKKISGILAETTETNDGIAVVVGIGINLKSSNFPPEIADIATSLESETKVAATGNLAESLTKYLTYFYEILRSENGPAEIINEWRRRSSYFSGKAVRVVLENETITGVTEGLEPNGALRIRRENGELAIIQAGDVEQLRSEL